jgi:hypothetical protein
VAAGGLFLGQAAPFTGMTEFVFLVAPILINCKDHYIRPLSAVYFRYTGLPGRDGDWEDICTLQVSRITLI